MRLLDDPTLCPMGYSADLYCKYEADHHPWDEFPHCYFAETKGQTLRQARRNGWIIHRDNTATCPRCAAALNRRTTPGATPNG